MPRLLLEAIVKLPIKTVVIEEVRPLYSPSQNISTDITKSMYLFGFITLACQVYEIECIVRQPQQKNAAFKMIKSGIIGECPRPLRLHFLDAEAHAISWMAEVDEKASNAIRAALIHYDL